MSEISARLRFIEMRASQKSASRQFPHSDSALFRANWHVSLARHIVPSKFKKPRKPAFFEKGHMASLAGGGRNYAPWKMPKYRNWGNVMGQIEAAQSTPKGEDFGIYVERARQLAPSLEAYAAQDDVNRYVHPDVVAKIREAGLFRLPVPRHAGGVEAPLRVTYEVLRAIGQYHLSASWIMMACGAHAYICGSFSDELHKEVSAEDPDWILAGGSAPLGKAVPVQGGYKVNGNFPFASGVDHAIWTIAGCQVDNGNHPDVPSLIMTFVPKRDLQIRDNWFTMGLRGTGSKLAVASDLFVPEHRTLPIPTLGQGYSEHAKRRKTPLYQIPLNMVMSYFPTGTLLGAAEAMLEKFVDMTRVRTDKYFGSLKAENPGLQFRVAESHHDIVMARLMFEHIADRLDHIVATGRRPDLAERAESRSACSFAVQRCREAVDRIFAASGANATYDSSPLQAAFRNINVGTHHATVDYDSWVEQFGRIRLGLKPNKIL
jgi:alkylation response protein AidB-like acyl-CoA dehydrogenase